jgi:hypothetical protein
MLAVDRTASAWTNPRRCQWSCADRDRSTGPLKAPSHALSFGHPLQGPRDVGRLPVGRVGRRAGRRLLEGGDRLLGSLEKRAQGAGEVVLAVGSEGIARFLQGGVEPLANLPERSAGVCSAAAGVAAPPASIRSRSERMTRTRRGPTRTARSGP